MNRTASVSVKMMHSMKCSEELLSTFDRAWDEFSAAWKKARSKSSEKAIHDLRVNTRRLIATLELSAAITRRDQISKLQRRFKKVLKRMGPLRDVQVQLENLSHLQQNGLIKEFKGALERRELRKTKNIRRELKRGKKARLSKAARNVRSKFSRFYETLGEEKIRAGVERVLTTRRNEFLKARHHFQPSQEQTLHEMRIALKKLRYAVEAAQPVLGKTARTQARE